MKRCSILICMLIFPCIIAAQNLQLHYDLGRRHFTSTLEMFRTDNLGSTFWFVDFDYNNSDGAKNASLGYWEIARYFSIPKVQNTSLTIQYNDGLTNEFSFNPVWLAGVQHVLNFGNLSIPVDFLVRREINTKGLTFQSTAVWFYSWQSFEISGYIDIWTTGSGAFPPSTWAFQSEPQFWYKLGKNIMFGAEIEISRNFSGAWTRKNSFEESRLFFIPTVAIKWLF